MILKPIAWLDAFGTPHKNHRDALVDFDPEHQPEPLYRAGDIAVLVEALKAIEQNAHWGASYAAATAHAALACGVAPCGGSCCDCGKGCTTDGVATVAPRDITPMIDAAMMEMSNIHPPLRRSECERLIHAALGVTLPREGKQ